jgi:hypothetical protein
MYSTTVLSLFISAPTDTDIVEVTDPDSMLRARTLRILRGAGNVGSALDTMKDLLRNPHGTSNGSGLISALYEALYGNSKPSAYPDGRPWEYVLNTLTNRLASIPQVTAAATATSTSAHAVARWYGTAALQAIAPLDLVHWPSHLGPLNYDRMAPNVSLIPTLEQLGAMIVESGVYTLPTSDAKRENKDKPITFAQVTAAVTTHFMKVADHLQRLRLDHQGFDIFVTCARYAQARGRDRVLPIADVDALLGLANSWIGLPPNPPSAVPEPGLLSFYKVHFDRAVEGLIGNTSLKRISAHEYVSMYSRSRSSADPEIGYAPIVVARRTKATAPDVREVEVTYSDYTATAAITVEPAVHLEGMAAGFHALFSPSKVPIAASKLIAREDVPGLLATLTSREVSSLALALSGSVEANWTSADLGGVGDASARERWSVQYRFASRKLDSWVNARLVSFQGNTALTVHPQVVVALAEWPSGEAEFHVRPGLAELIARTSATVRVYAPKDWAPISRSTAVTAKFPVVLSSGNVGQSFDVSVNLNDVFYQASIVPRRLVEAYAGSTSRSDVAKLLVTVDELLGAGRGVRGGSNIYAWGYDEATSTVVAGAAATALLTVSNPASEFERYAHEVEAATLLLMSPLVTDVLHRSAVGARNVIPRVLNDADAANEARARGQIAIALLALYLGDVEASGAVAYATPEVAYLKRVVTAEPIVQYVANRVLMLQQGRAR